MTLPDFETIEYHHLALNLNLICEEEDGEWTGEMSAPDGELLVKLPASSATTPDESSLNALAWAKTHLHDLRQAAASFAYADVLGDLNRWGLLDKEGKPHWETDSTLPRWSEMDDTTFSTQFVLMGLMILEDSAEGDCVLGFDTEIDGEHSVGVSFQAGQPKKLESWSNY
ncbi:hypothetical protein [Deinococcus sp. AJ005]|uniref:hypothetical protein n=1 Tax=Deinococcus sp. AJ005 TaxID=2652443 RepID=UPI00125CC925|nr:hypothetical protein [Deinococcus sp. AJ005]QFP78520.1 hypothetical protein DAAJ005_18270 [Deinococcus sp. AJ005]